MSTPSQHATQYIFPNKELIKILLRHLNIHEGYWTLSVNFGFAAVNMGTSADSDDMSPTGMVRLQGLGVQRVAETGPMVVDASVENPAK